MAAGAGCARLGGDGCGGEGEREGSSAVVVVPLVAEVGAVGVAAFAEHDVFGRAVDVAPVHGEALRGAEGAAYLLHGGGVAAQRLWAGAGDAADDGQKTGQRMLDIDHVPASVAPLGNVGGSLAVFHAPAHGGGEQRVPVLVAGGSQSGLACITISSSAKLDSDQR